MSDVVAVILAGGRATRLGGVDKALLQAGGHSLIGHVLARVAPQVGAVAVSANGEAARYAHLGRPVLADEVTGRGPLGGVLRGLAWAEQEGASSLLSVPGDTPFVPRHLVTRLGAAPAWAENAAGVHPLVAVWPVACRAALATWLADQASGRVRAFGGVIGMRAVWFADVPDPFLNVNTAADLEEVRKQAVLF